jgi:hypothetical protein
MAGATKNIQSQKLCFTPVLSSVICFCYNRAMTRRARLFSLWILALVFSACHLSAAPELPAAKWPCYTLRAEKAWHLNLPGGERFDASALCLRTNGDLLTVNDRHEGVYRIQFLPKTNLAEMALLPNCFTTEQLASFAADKIDRYDCEGLCEDEAGRFYICEEANRWILRWDPKIKKVDRLEIDWSPVEKYFHPTDRNASFEALAVYRDKLYVGNERQDGRIIVVDLKTLKVMEDFGVRPSNTRAKDIHYSDFCWFEGALFAVLRENHVVVKINPETQRIVAEYDYGAIEHAPDVAFETDNPMASLIEGIAVDQKYIWLCTDNNGRGLKNSPADTRPLLFKCPRPDENR